MGKGSGRRPTTISPEEERIRWLLAYGRISFAEFEKKYKVLRKRGLIWRR